MTPHPQDLTIPPEWFVTDYFTVDGAELAMADLGDAFVSGVDVPQLPHGDPDVTGTSYVEWARAFSVDEVTPRLYAVAVAFRSIHLADDGFRRGPVRAAKVMVAVDEEAVGIAELPTPIPVPSGARLAVNPTPGGDVPPEVVETALGYASLFNDDPQLISAGGGSRDWRVVVGLDDASGITFPVVIRSPEE